MKSIVKCLVFIAVISMGISFNAYAGQWVHHEGGYPKGEYKGAWEYVYDNGHGAAGWVYMNNNWYYFSPEDGCAGNGLKIIDGKEYCFDSNTCAMLHDQYVQVDENSSIYYWINSDGSIDYSNYMLE